MAWMIRRYQEQWIWCITKTSRHGMESVFVSSYSMRCQFQLENLQRSYSTTISLNIFLWMDSCALIKWRPPPEKQCWSMMIDTKHKDTWQQLRDWLDIAYWISSRRRGSWKRLLGTGLDHERYKDQERPEELWIWMHHSNSGRTARRPQTMIHKGTRIPLAAFVVIRITISWWSGVSSTCYIPSIHPISQLSRVRMPVFGFQSIQELVYEMRQDQSSGCGYGSEQQYDFKVDAYTIWLDFKACVHHWDDSFTAGLFPQATLDAFSFSSAPGSHHFIRFLSMILPSTKVRWSLRGKSNNFIKAYFSSLYDVGNSMKTPGHSLLWRDAWYHNVYVSMAQGTRMDNKAIPAAFLWWCSVHCAKVDVSWNCAKDVPLQLSLLVMQGSRNGSKPQSLC